MLQYTNYKLQIMKRSLEEGSLWSPHWWSARWVPPHLIGRLLFFLKVVLEAPAEVPPNQHGVGGGVPPKWRLPHPPHSGPLERRP